MKTIKKIKKLAFNGDLLAAISLAIDTTKSDAPQKENLFSQRNALKKLKRDYKNQVIDDITYKKELNQLINGFMATTHELSENPQLLKRTGLLTKWWFWVLALLFLWWAYRYFNRPLPPPPPPPVATLTFTNSFQLSASDNEALKNTTAELNRLHTKKLELQKLLQLPSENPLVQFTTEENKLKDTLQQWLSGYQMLLADLEKGIAKKYSGYAIYFDPNQAEVSDTTATALKAFGKLLNSTDLHLKIIGHTDGVGSPEKNQQLSCDRANAAKEYLLTVNARDRNTLEPKITVDCLGDRNLLPQIDKRARENRRVDLWLVAGK